MNIPEKSIIEKHLNKNVIYRLMSEKKWHYELAET